MRQTYFDAIDKERDRQDKQWGGAIHDDKHNSHDWVAYITVFLGEAVRSKNWVFNPRKYKESMIKIAALCVAAAEWTDRNFPEE